MINHYKILNVSENASELQIKKAFRILALKLHPDTTKSHNSYQFLQVKNSYDILIDEKKRKIFDTQLYIFRNPEPKYSDLDLGKLAETRNHKENTSAKIFNFILKIATVAILITLTTYSCEFINKNSLNNKNNFSNKNVSLPEDKRNSDSLMSEDQKLEKELQNTKEKKQTNGELKF